MVYRVEKKYAKNMRAAADRVPRAHGCDDSYREL